MEILLPVSWVRKFIFPAVEFCFCVELLLITGSLSHETAHDGYRLESGVKLTLLNAGVVTAILKKLLLASVPPLPSLPSLAPGLNLAIGV